MQRHEYLAGGTSDTKMQGILGSLVQGRCKVSNLPAKQTNDCMVIIPNSQSSQVSYKGNNEFLCTQPYNMSMTL